MTQGENVNPCPRKKTQREGKFPIQEREKTQKKKREFPIQEREKTQREGKFPIKESNQKKERKILDQGSGENKRNMQKGL